MSRESLSRWARDGAVTPDVISPGGHYRWDLEKLRQQLQRRRTADDDDGPPFAEGLAHAPRHPDEPT